MEYGTRALVATIASVFDNNQAVKSVLDTSSGQVWPIRGWNDSGYFSFVNEQSQQRIVGTNNHLYDIKKNAYIKIDHLDRLSFSGYVESENCYFTGSIAPGKVSVFDVSMRCWNHFQIEYAQNLNRQRAA